MSSKRYPEEFKREAVRQIVDRGYSVSEIAERLGRTTHSLDEWKKDGPAAVHEVASEEQAEIQRLKKERKRVAEERDILKNPRRTSRTKPSEVRVYQGRDGFDYEIIASLLLSSIVQLANARLSNSDAFSRWVSSRYSSMLAGQLVTMRPDVWR